MSFCSNPNLDCQPGCIRGNPTAGLTEKACIDVKKVIDAGLVQKQVIDVAVPIMITSAQLGDSPTTPYTFVSAMSSQAKAVVSNVIVERLNTSNPRTARVKCTAGIPMQIQFVGQNGVSGVATGVLPVSLDGILCVPDASIIPYEVEVNASAIASEGIFGTATSMTLTCCVTCVLKLVISCELLVPSYGYCRIPPLLEFTADACAGFNDLPLYPL